MRKPQVRILARFGPFQKIVLNEMMVTDSARARPMKCSASLMLRMDY